MSYSDSDTYNIHEGNTPSTDTNNTSSQLNPMQVLKLTHEPNNIFMKMNNPTTALWNENGYNYHYFNNKPKCKPSRKVNKSRIVSCGVLSCFGIKTSRNNLKINLSSEDSKTSNTYKSTSSLQTASLSLTEKKISLPIDKINKPPSSIQKIKTTTATIPLSSGEKIPASCINNFKAIGDFNISHIKPNSHIFPCDLNRLSTSTSDTFESECIQTMHSMNQHYMNESYSTITPVSISQQIHYYKADEQNTKEPLNIDIVKEKIYSSQLLMHFSQIVEQNYNMDIKSLNYLQIENNVDDDGDNNNKVNTVDELPSQVLINFNSNIDHHQTCQAYIDLKMHESPLGMREANCCPAGPPHLHKVIQTVYSYENLCPRVSQSVKSYHTENDEENLKNNDLIKAGKMDEDEKTMYKVKEITTNSSKQSKDHNIVDNNIILNKSFGSSTKTSSESIKQEVGVVEGVNTSQNRTVSKGNTVSVSAVKQNCKTTKQSEVRSKCLENKSTVNNNPVNSSRDLKTPPLSSHLQNSHYSARKSNSRAPSIPSRTWRAGHSLPNKGNSYMSVKPFSNPRYECKKPEPVSTNSAVVHGAMHKNAKSEIHTNSYMRQNLRRGMPSASFREDPHYQKKLKQDIFGSNQEKAKQKSLNGNQKHQLNNRNSFMSTKENIKCPKKSTQRSFDRFQTYSTSSESCSSVNTLDLLQLADISDENDIREIKEYVFDEDPDENDYDISRRTKHFTNKHQVNNKDYDDFVGFPVDRHIQNRYIYPSAEYVYPEMNNPLFIQPKYWPFLPIPPQPVVPLRNINPLWNNIPNYESTYPNFMRPPVFNTPPFVNWTTRNSYINPYNNKYYNDPYYQYPNEQCSTYGSFPLPVYQSYNNTYHNSQTTSERQAHIRKTVCKNKVCEGGKKKKP
ncbi:unnamed protein product [Trichobilharzia regenti]|uniref:Non-specific serine/threonine protein kinase n=1 Tax=Trichobilharzia regenti TaxID=157069 RepID=A0A183WDR1_TRIRE|nr:unnamed protein product [Trichobilharzia regenti]VDQ06144.1 unnamed protein product [Trichobilharzia regenti]